MKASTVVSEVENDDGDAKPGPHKEDAERPSRAQGSLEVGLLRRTSLVMRATKRARAGMKRERQAEMPEGSISMVKLGMENHIRSR